MRLELELQEALASRKAIEDLFEDAMPDDDISNLTIELLLVNGKIEQLEKRLNAIKESEE